MVNRVIFARLFYVLFGGALVASGIALAFQATHSDSDELLGGVFLGLPVLFLLAGLSFHATARVIRGRLLRRWNAALIYVIFLVAAYAAFQITYSCLVPSNIRFEFSYPGNTGTYQMVQFYFKHDGRWLEGPSVEAWPLIVRFPDLNGDGYPDIRVIDAVHGGVVDFVYLPQNDGRIFWRGRESGSELRAAYAPADYFSNYP